VEPNIAFMGAGAIGSYLGAFLTRAGYRPTLIDPWPEHIEAMKSGGLRASGSQGDFTVEVEALHLGEVQRVARPFDIVFISMKSYDTEWAATFMKGYLAPTGFMVCAQNGINDETIARIVGYERTVGCTISSITVGMVGPGHVFRGGPPGRERGHDVFRVGELNGILSPRVNLVAEMLDNVDGSRATTNIWGERWSKLATNCMGNALSAMSGLGADELAQRTPKFSPLRDQVAREVVSVGLALGVNIEPIGGRPAASWLEASPPPQPADRPAPPARAAAPAGGPSWQTSTLQDVIKGRKTEIDYLNGYVSARGREAGIRTPVNDAIVTVLKEVEAGLVAADPANVDRVWGLSRDALDRAP
jgi:2-dehydropantoate 2-reductase